MMRPFLNYAHRGASAYAPENTMSAFALGVQMGANAIETDVRRTKDGVLVLFHDANLKRVTGFDGSVQDLTLAELKRLDVSAYGKMDKIPTLEEFLAAFANTALSFAVELKQDFIEADTIDLLRKYGVMARTTLTSFQIGCLMRAKVYAPACKAGFLTKDVNPLTVPVAKTIGLTELCPPAAICSPALVARLHGEGFSVRAYGVETEAQMRAVYDAGADGMTVNFPDLLTSYLSTQA